MTQRLVKMEAFGMVRRGAPRTRPIAVVYEMTDFGRSALDVLEQLKTWAEDHDI